MQIYKQSPGLLVQLNRSQKSKVKRQKGEGLLEGFAKSEGLATR